jgi:hypothetical protein
MKTFFDSNADLYVYIMVDVRNPVKEHPHKNKFDITLVHESGAAHKVKRGKAKGLYFHPDVVASWANTKFAMKIMLMTTDAEGYIVAHITHQVDV